MLPACVTGQLHRHLPGQRPRQHHRRPLGARSNLISGNSGDGIVLLDTQAVHTLVQGNLIGTDRSGTGNLANAGDGIHFRNTSNNMIGGTTAGSGNTIGFNTGAGVFVESGVGNAILGNSFLSNGGPGIDLFPTGPTPNRRRRW